MSVKVKVTIVTIVIFMTSTFYNGLVFDNRSSALLNLERATDSPDFRENTF